MTDPMTADLDGFDEAAYDAAQDGRWREFRIRLADYLADLCPADPPFLMFDFVDTELGQSAAITAVCDGDDRLELAIDGRTLAATVCDHDGRVRLLRDDGWAVHGDDSLLRDFDLRHVDAAAVAVEHAFREVWGIPDPSYLLGDENDILRQFTDPQERRNV
ncbi:TY-Chap domain-containing protein [Gordonia zhaorongruii]|uniref:TY-Chap domain-containing protein n=1 Tax=Gordonia zhaorongruii TaxID=2597659 RepID=UPI001050AEE6|nr:hypothetical protein [Gordonia zhaorongruii]